MLPLGTQEDKGHDPSLRCQRALAFGQKWDPTRAAAGCSCHAAYPRSRWLQSPLNVKKGFKELIHNSILCDHRPYSPYSQPCKKSESANSRFQSFALSEKSHIGFLCYSILPNLLYRTLKICHETTQKALEVDGGTSPSHVYIQVIRICTKWILQLDGNGMQNPEDKNRHKCKNTSGIIEMFTL